MLGKCFKVNSVRVGMVEKLVDYKWSSYVYNALGEADD